MKCIRAIPVRPGVARIYAPECKPSNGRPHSDVGWHGLGGMGRFRYSGIRPWYFHVRFRFSSQMPHRVMAAHAGQGITRPRSDIDTSHHGRMASATSVFRNGFIHLRRLQRLVKSTGSEGQRVVEPVNTLDRVFTEKVMRGMTIVADRDGVMAGLKPGIVVVLHDVAIRAGGRVVGEIRRSLGVDKRIPGQAGGRAAQEAKNHGQKSHSSMHVLRSRR